MPKVNREPLGVATVWLRPLPEQPAIVEYLDEQIGKTDRTTEAAGREVDLLKELRARLIAGVVTGKLDVRELATRLSPEGDQLDAIATDDDASVILGDISPEAVA